MDLALKNLAVVATLHERLGSDVHLPIDLLCKVCALHADRVAARRHAEQFRLVLRRIRSGDFFATCPSCRVTRVRTRCRPSCYSSYYDFQCENCWQQLWSVQGS